MSRSPALVVHSLLLAVAAVIALTSCSSANVSGGVSVSSGGWYGPWGYDNYWYDTPGTVIVGPPIHPRPLPPDVRPNPPPRPVQPLPPPRPMPRPPMGGGGRRR